MHKLVSNSCGLLGDVVVESLHGLGCRSSSASREECEQILHAL